MSAAEASPRVYVSRPAREPREREIDFSPIGGIVPVAILAGVAYLGYQYKDEILGILKNLDAEINSKIKDLPPITLPSLPKLGTGSGSSTPSTDNTPTGNQWYKANGTEAKMPNARCSSGKCGTGSGGNSGGNRWENEVKGFLDTGFEVVVYFQIPSGGMCKGGHIGLKHGGPNHTSPCEYSTGGSCCCWWDTGIDNDAGKSYVEIEYPHPNNKNRKYFADAGTKLDSGKPIGIRWHISKEGGGMRLMQWIDTSGTAGAYKWRETYNVLDTGQFMPKSYKPTNMQNIEIRISDVDCKAIKMLQGPTSRKITGSGSTANPAYAQAYSAVDMMRPLYSPRISMA